MVPLDRIRLRREQLGIRQIDLAYAVGVSQSTMSDYETGRTEPNLETLLKIARVLKTSVSWLIREEPIKVITITGSRTRR